MTSTQGGSAPACSSFDVISSISCSLCSNTAIEAIHLDQCNLSKTLGTVPEPHAVRMACNVASRYWILRGHSPWHCASCKCFLHKDLSVSKHCCFLLTCCSEDNLLPAQQVLLSCFRTDLSANDLIQPWLDHLQQLSWVTSVVAVQMFLNLIICEGALTCPLMASS